jgi:hypothetical protein
MVADQQQQQAAFNIALTRVENTMHDRGLDEGNSRHHNPGNEDDDLDFPTVHKLKFPKYDGTSDPPPWLNRCDR